MLEPTALGVELVVPDQTTAGWRPTGFMQKVSDHLTLYPGASKNALRDLGNSEYVDAAVKRLVAEGFVRIEQSGQRHLHHLIRPFDELDDLAHT